MSGTMEQITKLALAEMIESHTSPSRFGYVMSEENYRGLIDALYEFFETSRSLKSAGDRMLGLGSSPANSKMSRPVR